MGAAVLGRAHTSNLSSNIQQNKKSATFGGTVPCTPQEFVAPHVNELETKKTRVTRSRNRSAQANMN
jgi:hypothetical protein